MATATTFTITGVKEKKRGTTNGRAWVLHEITASNGARYCTFDATWAQNISATVTVEVTKTDRGLSVGTFPSRAQAAVLRAGNIPLTAPATAAAPDKFAVLDGKLDRILAEIAGLRSHFS